MSWSEELLMQLDVILARLDARAHVGGLRQGSQNLNGYCPELSTLAAVITTLPQPVAVSG